MPAARSVTIRPMTEYDLPAVDHIFRRALGTFLGLPCPEDFSGDAAVPHCRLLEHPEGALVAERHGGVVGSNFVSQWGRFGLFGPLTVPPELWNQGIGQALLDATMDLFARLDIRQRGIFTFAHSPRHLALYERYGFYPQHLNLVLGKKIRSGALQQPAHQFSRLTPGQQEEVLQEARRLTDSLYEGLDLSREILAVDEHGWGDTLVLWDGDRLNGFAVCHAGRGTEAGSGVLYAKFGAATAECHFHRLLEGCEALAAAWRLSAVWTGVNAARRRAYAILAQRGYRIEISGVAMQSPDRPGFNRPDLYIMDDWR